MYIFERQPDRSASVVYFSNCSRSGTTLLSRMLHSDDLVTSFSEPDAYTPLAQLAQQRVWEGQELADIIGEILKSSLIFMLLLSCV